LFQVQPFQVACAASTQSAYLAAFGNDGEFTNMWDYAVDRGYDPTLRGVLACNEGYGTTSFMANLTHPTLPAFVIVSRHGDFAPGFNTFLYQSETASVRWVHASTFSMKIVMTGSNQVQDIEFYDVDGTLLTAAGAHLTAEALTAAQLQLCSDVFQELWECQHDYFTDASSLVALGARVVAIGGCFASINPATGAFSPLACGFAVAGWTTFLQDVATTCPQAAGVACSDEETCVPGTCRWSGGRASRLNCIPTPGAPSLCGGTACCSAGQCVCSQDDFERSLLGGNWASANIPGADVCLIRSSSDYTGGEPYGGICYWDGLPQSSTTAQYACGQLSGPTPPATASGSCGEAGVCLAMDAARKAVCCAACPAAVAEPNDGFLGYWVLGVVQNNAPGSGWSYAANNVVSGWEEVAIDPGDYMGIERDSNGTTFRCYHSRDGRNWALLGSLSQGGMPLPGRPGALAADSGGQHESFTIERWEAGNDRLPTTRTCGM